MRLAFGLSSAPEVFHRTVLNLMSDLDGVEVYIDDILVHAETREQHDRRLRAVLERCRSIGLKLNESKCVFESRGRLCF